MAEKLTSRHVHVVEAGGDARRDHVVCLLDTDIRFDLRAMASYFFKEWNPLAADAMTLAAAVEFCDVTVKRKEQGLWGREFHLVVPMYEPSHWRNGALDAAVNALSTLTGDTWHIEVVKRQQDPVHVPHGMFDLAERELPIMPYSDGLDSRITADLIESQGGGRLIRVRLGDRVVAKESKSKKAQPFVALPYRVVAKRRETSARSRGFKFLTLSGIAAHFAGSSEILVPESGQGALGPSLVTVGHVHSDLRNHPRFTHAMARYIQALFGDVIEIRAPRLWYTKGETLNEFVSTVGGEWENTKSCWRDSRHSSMNNTYRQCGICAACMLRRMSVHAAGLHEAPETYLWDNLRAVTFEHAAPPDRKWTRGGHHKYAIAGVLHLRHLAELAGSERHAMSFKRESLQLSRFLSLPQNEVEQRLGRLLRQHRVEFENFIDFLGAESFVARWIVRRHHNE